MLLPTVLLCQNGQISEKILVFKNQCVIERGFWNWDNILFSLNFRWQLFTPNCKLNLYGEAVFLSKTISENSRITK